MFQYSVPFYYFLCFAASVLLLCALYNLFTIRPKRSRYGELSEKEQAVINMSTD